ncbi:hypothetical protein GOP47_0017814 [Adiantum capillus-veneris]|uniref:Uncharacterized protein n=1 Tax=Adiantum capillus-veneris TaxID=13818 RepID=A0A9D4ZC57_ADICA|nr:hypothetical protein GOP47_0017814 [Adiantum capillus-veneris]
MKAVLPSWLPGCHLGQYMSTNTPSYVIFIDSAIMSHTFKSILNNLVFMEIGYVQLCATALQSLFELLAGCAVVVQSFVTGGSMVGSCSWKKAFDESLQLFFLSTGFEQRLNLRVRWTSRQAVSVGLKYWGYLLSQPNFKDN